jgi:hypothetical protein
MDNEDFLPCKLLDLSGLGWTSFDWARTGDDVSLRTVVLSQPKSIVDFIFWPVSVGFWFVFELIWRLGRGRHELHEGTRIPGKDFDRMVLLQGWGEGVRNRSEQVGVTRNGAVCDAALRKSKIIFFFLITA